MERTVMNRENRRVETPYGSADVKVCSYGSIRKIYPEYESVRAICEKSGNGFREVYQAILDVCE